MTKPFMLLILDGWGQAPAGPGNAVSLAQTPNLDRLMQQWPTSSLLCKGADVGLPPGQMGNSEVGHLNLGAGRIVYQDIMRINLALKDGSMAENVVLNELVAKAQAGSGRVHLMGLVSDGGVHSDQTHLESLLAILQAKGVQEVYIHAFLDGRDTPPTSGADYVQQLQTYIDNLGLGRIATVCGRYYAMDRDKRWDRVEKAYNALVYAQGVQGQDAVLAIKDSYAQDKGDEFVLPTVIDAKGCLQDGDGVLFFNFRADRARELTRTLFDDSFNDFERKKCPNLSYLATMTVYDSSFGLPVLFVPQKLNNILGELVSKNNMTQLRIAETEKYAHVTYFFSGGQEDVFPGEDRILIPSPKEVATYDLKPQMSVYLVTEALCDRLENNPPDLVVCNFANLDMVGHTGIIPAATAACEAVDECVGKVVETLLKAGGSCLITADHGNAETMLDENGAPWTAHSLNPVPIVAVGPVFEGKKLREQGRLADVAPTILNVWGMEQPQEMNGKSILKSGEDDG